MSEKPGRYNRSTGGLIGSMIVLVALVGAFVLFRGTFRDTPEYKPANLDYRSVVREAAGGGVSLVAPRSLPDGWRTTAVTFTPGDRWKWDLALLTSAGRFVGLHEEDDDAVDLLTTLIDENPQQGDDLQVQGSVAPTWQSWTGSGGDHAFTAEVGEGETRRTVVVYGSAPVADLKTVVESLEAGQVTGRTTG